MEFLSLALLGILIVISPGADFVLVFKNSVDKGRKVGVITSLGIAVGVCVHVGYSIVGIGHLISQSEWLLSFVKYTGAGYLIYLGLMGVLRSNGNLNVEQIKITSTSKVIISQNYFIQGFLCNLLNPKTVLFFLSIFSQLFSSDNNVLFALAYGMYIVILHGVWFCIIAFFITSENFFNTLKRFSKQINQLCGFSLLVFGILLTLSE